MLNQNGEERIIEKFQTQNIGVYLMFPKILMLQIDDKLSTVEFLFLFSELTVAIQVLVNV